VVVQLLFLVFARYIGVFFAGLVQDRLSLEEMPCSNFSFSVAQGLGEWGFDGFIHGDGAVRYVRNTSLLEKLDACWQLCWSSARTYISDVSSSRGSQGISCRVEVASEKPLASLTSVR
jgi:hypothetical protein